METVNQLTEKIHRVRWSTTVKWWLWEQILTLYRRHAYRHVMRVAHRYNWHYAPPQGLMHGEKPDGQKRHWCMWCGLRGNTVDLEHFKAPLSPN